MAALPTALPWDQEPEFLAATNWTLAPNVPAEYGILLPKLLIRERIQC